MTVISEKKSTTSLVGHDQALKVYLDSLLFEEAPAMEVAKPVRPQQQEVLPSSQPAKQDIEPLPKPSLPEWGRRSFESVLFKVGGFLTLAIPLTKLNGIIDWPGLQPSSLPVRTDWFLGVVSHQGKQVKVIDVAKVVIPKNHKAWAGLKAERKLSQLILIMGGEYGLACDGLGDVLKLSPDDVRWGDASSSRPWLAGTITKKMCAIIDIDHFLEMLKLESG